MSSFTSHWIKFSRDFIALTALEDNQTENTTLLYIFLMLFTVSLFYYSFNWDVLVTQKIIFKLGFSLFFSVALV